MTLDPPGLLRKPVDGTVAAYRRVEPYLPATFFFGGFAWDSLTLGRAYGPLDLWFLGVYYAGTAVALVLLGRRVSFRFSDRLNLALQFLFGSLFSAFTVLYFISASSWPSLLFVGIVAGLLVANEFLERRYADQRLAWAFFSFAGVMFLNFALPHVFHSVSPWWFYLSTALGLALGYVVRRLATGEKASFTPSWIVGGVLVLAFLLNWIPPVPLVKTDMVVGRNFDRGDRQHYSMEIEKPPFWWFWKRSDRTVHQRAGEKVWCYTAIFLPRGIEARIVHHWEYDDPQKGWTTLGRVPVSIRGGRTDGFRAWSYKQALPPGRWRVTAETPNGQVIGIRSFRVTPAAAGEPLEFRKVKLR